MAVTYTEPTSFAETQSSSSNLPPAWILAQGGLTRKLVDGLDVLGLGIFEEEPIDMAGQKADAARWGDVSGIGFEQAMSSAGSEVSAITPSTQTTAYGSVSIGEYVIAYSETFRNQILMGSSGNGVNLTLDELIMVLPENYLKTLRGLLYADGATISAITVGATTTKMSMDDMYDLVGAFAGKYGAGALGAPVLSLRATQHSEIVESARSESFLFGTDLIQRMQRVNTGQVLEDPYGIGINVALTDEVVSSGGVLKGFCVSPRTYKRAIASPRNVRVPVDARKMVLDRFGLLIWERTGGNDTRTSGVNAYCNIGVGRRSADTRFQALVRSKG